MSDAQELQRARQLVISGQIDAALPILWRLYASRDLNVRLNAALALLSTLNRVTESQKLREVVDAAIKLAAELRRTDVYAYLLAQKATYLFDQLNTLVYRQRNLILASALFKWIDFSLDRDKQEFEANTKACGQLEKEIGKLAAEALKLAESVTNHYTRGHIFSTVADVHFSTLLYQQLKNTAGGRIASSIANLYYVRRLHLDRFIVLDRRTRKAIREAKRETFRLFAKALAEFQAGGLQGDLAYVYYNLALKRKLTFNFARARRYIKIAKRMAEANNDRHLLNRAVDLEKDIQDKYRHPRDYVKEWGLDLPRSVRRGPFA